MTPKTPAADWRTLLAHLPGQRAALNGARGQLVDARTHKRRAA